MHNEESKKLKVRCYAERTIELNKYMIFFLGPRQVKKLEIRN